MGTVVFVSTQRPPDALGLLNHEIFTVADAAGALKSREAADVMAVDGRTDLSRARAIIQSIRQAHDRVPILLLVATTGIALISRDWGYDDFLTEGCDPTEYDARIRGLLHAAAAPEVLTIGPLQVDEVAYTATLAGSQLDLTYTEFELIRCLLQHSDRVLTREMLLSQVWGYDYYGGTRTVDVHVRRLRAKLGNYDYLIGTVRNVGYRITTSRDELDD